MSYDNGNETTNRSIEEEGHLIDVLGEGFRTAKMSGGEGGKEKLKKKLKSSSMDKRPLKGLP